MPPSAGCRSPAAARRIVATEERGRLLGLLEARYPFLHQMAAGPEKLRQAYARISVYRLEPLRVVMIDNGRGFGHKEVLDLTAEFPR